MKLTGIVTDLMMTATVLTSRARNKSNCAPRINNQRKFFRWSSNHNVSSIVPNPHQIHLIPRRNHNNDHKLVAQNISYNLRNLNYFKVFLLITTL